MANVTFTYNPQPAPACYPSDVNGLAQELTTGGMLVGTIPDNAGGGVYVGSSPPSSALTNKVWYKTDAAGRPLGVFMFYNGNWRKVYTGVAVGEIRHFFGSNSYFDGSGRGIVGGDLDGWAVCNGANGTPNLHGCNLKGGHLGVSVGRGDGWWSDMETPGVWVQSGGTWGGPNSGHQITINNLPQLLYGIYGDNRAQGGSGAWEAAGPGGTANEISFSYINGTQFSPNTPMAWETYTVVGHIMFVGYQ